MNKKTTLWFLVLLVILFASILFAFVCGSASVGIKEIFDSLIHPQIISKDAVIIRQLRFPRIILGLLVGAGLACAGSVFQAVLRNGLAEPYTLGVSSGAALGAAIGMLMNCSTTCTSVFAFIGSLITISFVYAVASKKRFSNPTLILSGVTLSLVFSSLVLLIFALGRQESVHSTIVWLMGDLSYVKGELIRATSVFIIPGIIILVILGRDIDIICLGEEKARHLGLNVQAIKGLIFLISSLLTGACVSICGIIGFIGLIIPHFARFLFGINHRRLLLGSAILGAAFLVFCDTISRTIIRPLELPVGVITGIFGGVFFLFLLLKSKRWEVM